MEVARLALLSGHHALGPNIALSLPLWACTRLVCSRWSVIKADRSTAMSFLLFSRLVPIPWYMFSDGH